MILVAAYPHCFEASDNSVVPLQRLRRILNELCDRRTILHLLPFFVADGDGGFACRDWLSIDQRFGAWNDIRDIARDFRVIADGIYNHVGYNHRWVQEFLAQGTGYERLHVYLVEPSAYFSRSPRGGPVLHGYNIYGRTWSAWQTFSRAAIDVRLDNPDVVAEIERQLALLKQLGVWGIRLDGVAYYGKALGEPQFHHLLAKGYARKIAMLCNKHKLRIIAQLDCDDRGLSYFPSLLPNPTPVMDYSYPAVLALSLLSEDPVYLAKHLERTWNLNAPVMRALRTHDGIFMRSALFSHIDRARLIVRMKDYNVEPRLVEAEPYEFNCSFPYLCSLGVDEEGMWRRIIASLVIAMSSTGWCYVYLPVLFGFRPELTRATFTADADPRVLNRIPISLDVVESATRSAYAQTLCRLIRQASELRQLFDLDIATDGDSVKVVDGVLIIERAAGRLQVFANLNRRRSIVIPLRCGEEVFSENIYNGRIGPLGCGIFVK